MSEPVVIAYLTSVYGRASDSFIRGEVAALRRRGNRVHTFSIRRPADDELVSDDIRSERMGTDYVLASGAATIARASVLVAARHPQRTLRTLALALRCSTPGVRGRAWALAYWAEGAYLSRRLRSLDVSHLHVHISEGVATAGMLGASLAGISFSVAVHGSGEFDHPRSLALDRKVAHAGFFTAISDFTRSQVLRWIEPDDWSKVHVVRCAVAPRFLAREPDPVPDTGRVVCVGRLETAKGHAVLLESLARVAGAELVVVGDGPLRARLERMAERLGVAERVEFAGWLGASDVERLLRDARALVVSSFAEGLPVVVMEALALGRPVVATDVGALSELVRDGGTGWLVRPGSVEALAEALDELIRTPTRTLTEMGARGAALVRERHDPEREAAKLERLIRAAQAPRSTS